MYQTYTYVTPKILEKKYENLKNLYRSNVHKVSDPFDLPVKM